MPLPVQKLAPAIARSEEAAALHRQSAGPVSRSMAPMQTTGEMSVR